jgi:RNA polymerase sigma factor (sigma-70 family)
MADSGALAAQFEALRPHLHSVAYRILGSAGDADDAVQETWLRLSRADVSGVASPRGWLTTVISRVALNMIESRGSRREDMSGEPPEPATSGRLAAPAPAPGPEDEALLDAEVSAALQVVLDTLEPRERLAFVLHREIAGHRGTAGGGLPHRRAAVPARYVTGPGPAASRRGGQAGRRYERRLSFATATVAYCGQCLRCRVITKLACANTVRREALGDTRSTRPFRHLYCLFPDGHPLDR